MKVKDIVVLDKTSKKGNKYQGLFAILENGKEIFIAFVR